MKSLPILEKYVTQSNPLIEARKDMNLTEMRLFVLGLQDIKPHIKDDVLHDVEFHETFISYAELKEIFGSDFNGNITNLKKQVKNASRNVIEFTTKSGGFGYATIYRKMVYEPNKGLYIHFNDEMKKHILELVNQAYTKYKVKALFSLSSVYAWRILEILLEKQGYFQKGHSEIWVDLSIKDLRFALNIPDGLYKGKMCNFRSRVLDLPIKEINEKTDYIVRYETQKAGRKITGFTLYMKIKEKEKKALPAPMSEEEKLEKEVGQVKLIEPPDTATPRGLSDEEQEAYDSLVNREVDPDVALQLAKKYNLSQIKRNIKYALERKNDNTRNLKGMIVSYIRQDKAGVQAIQKKEAQERIAQRQLDRRQAYDDFHGTHLAEIGRARADKGERKEEAPPAPKELTELEVDMIVKKGEKAMKPFLEKMKKLGLTIDDVKAGKRK